MEITPVIKEDYITISDESTLSEMIGKLKQFEKRSALVFRNKKYLGLIGKKKLLRANIDASHTKLSKFIEKTPIINEHAEIIETAYLMFQSNTDFLPVESDKTIIGVVDGLDLANLAAKIPETDHVKVKDLKLVKAKKLNKNDPLSTALTIMFQERLDQVPLFDQGKLYGVITYRDILRKYLNWSPKRDVSANFNKMASSRSAEVDMPKLAALPVSSFSTNDNLVSVSSKDSFKNVVDLMVKNKLHCILVVDDEDYIGVLNVKNILRYLGSLKTPENYNIKFVGLSKLGWHPYEQDALKKIAGNEALKLQRSIKNELNLTLHLKEYEKEGGKQKISVTLRLEFPGQIVSVSQEAWDWRAAVRKSFANAENKVKKMFK